MLYSNLFLSELLSRKPLPPPPKPEGELFFGEGYPWVHTVEEQDGLVYALDVKSGLYILRVTEQS